MIDSIGTSSIQSAALRAQPQASVALQVAEAAPSATTLPTTRIRVDNYIDRAIIEVRSSENGQVLRQYPTQSQLRAFARAEALRQAKQNEAAAARQQSAAQQQPDSSSRTVSSNNASTASAPQPRAEAKQSAPAPQAAEADSNSTQSVDV